MEPNGAAGEVAVKIGARDFTMRPSYDAIQKIEGRIGSWLALSARLVAADLRYGDFTPIIYFGIRASFDSKSAADAEAPSEKEIADWLIENGLQEAVKPISDFVTIVFMGRRKKKQVDEIIAAKAGNQATTTG